MMNKNRTTVFLALYYTVASVVYRRLYVTLCIVTKRCVREQKLLLAAYTKSIVTKMNNLDLCLKIV